MRKFIIRVLFAGLFCFLAFIIFVAVCFWMATHPPAFYAKLMEQQFTAADQEQAEQRFQDLTDSIELWARQSARLQRDANRLGGNSGPNFLEMLAALAQPDVEENRQVTIAQDDINAVLSSRKISGDQLRDVRVQLADDRIRLGGSLVIEKTTTLYVSLDFQLNMEADGNLRVDLLTGRLGRIPLPMRSILSLIGDEINDAKKVKLDLDTSPVSITFQSKQPKPDMFKLDQIVCKDGALTLELSAPPIAY